MSYFDQLMKQAKENDTKKLGGRSNGATSPASPVSGKLSQSSDNFSLLMKQARKNDNRRIAGTQFGFGNIDLTSRPSFRNADGSISTVDSASYNLDGKEVLLPTVWVKDGKAYHSDNDAEIVQRYKETGEYLGKFDTPELADEYAQALHEAQAEQYTTKKQGSRANTKAHTASTASPATNTAAKKQQLAELKAQLAAEKAKLAPDRVRTTPSGRKRKVSSDRAHRLGGDAAKRRELERQIRATEQELAEAEKAEKANEFYSVWADPDFQQTSSKGSAKKGNVVVSSRAHKNPQGHRGRAGEDSHVVDAAYSNMTEDEVKTYNYLYETDERKAKEYLAFIREDLNARQGEKEGKLVRENPDAYGRVVGTIVYGAGAGLDQFGSGVAQFLSPERRPTSATQFGSAYIREDLKDSGPQLPDWLGGASVGQAAYDAVTTTANMAPSILLSALTAGAGAPAAAAQAAGTAALGVGAAGNAYGQALAEGRSKTEARLYSTLIGASEAGLQSVLGGIGAFGGSLAHLPKVATLVNNIDNSLLRISTNLGVKMLSEGGEEYLQEILDPVFRNMIYGENNDVALWTPDATYSFLLGALTAGLLDGAGSVRSDIQINRDGAQIKGAKYDNALIDAALKLDPETEAYSTAKQIKNGALKNTTHNIGELFYQYARAEGDMGIFAAPATEKTEAQSADRLDAVTTALMGIDMGNGQHMNLKTAKQKADIIQRCLNGEAITPADVNKLNLTQAPVRELFEQFLGGTLPTDYNKLSATEQVAAVQRMAKTARESTNAAAEKALPATQAVPEGNFTPVPEMPAQATQEGAQTAPPVTSVTEPSGPISYEEFAALVRESEPGASDAVVRQFYEQYAGEMNTGAGETISLEGVDHPMTYGEFEQFMQALSEQLGQPLPDDVSLREMFDEKLAEQGVDRTEQTTYNKEDTTNGREGNESRGAEPQRTNGVASEEPGRSVPGGAEEAPARGSTQRLRAKDLRDRVRNAGDVAAERSAREVGVQGGTEKQSLRVVPEDLYTDEMREVRDAYGAQGVTVHYFTGYLNIADGEGGSFNARAAVSPDGETMWVKADHDELSVQRLAQHEDFHRLAQQDSKLLANTVNDIVATHGQSELSKMVSRYIAQYGWTDRSNADIIEEICADAYAGIDIFNHADPLGKGAESFNEAVEQTVERTVGFRRRLGKEARDIVKRIRRGETPSFDELMSIPEVREAAQREDRGGTQTADLPNRETIQAKARENALRRGSYSGEDANGNAQYNGPVKQERRMDIVIGLPGSGKSSVYSEGLSAEHQARISDVDDIRPDIPEYDGTNSWLVHKEAKRIAETALAEMMERGDNIVLSILGDNAEKLRDRIQDYTDNRGYEVYLHLNELPNEKAVARAVYRYLTDGRWVNLKMIHDFGDKPTQAYLELTGQKGANNGSVRNDGKGETRGEQGPADVSRSGGVRGQSGLGAREESRRGTPEEHRLAGADAGTGAQVQQSPAPRDGGKEIRLAGFDRYSNDVKRGEPPKLDRATSSTTGTYERAKLAKDNVKKGIKFSTETTDAEYASTLNTVVSLMNEYGLYVPSVVKDALNAANNAVQPTTELGASTLLSDALFGSDSYDVYEDLWDDEKQEIVELLDTLKGLEETAAANKQTGYQSAVKNLIDFMEEHGLKVPAHVKDNLDSLTPEQQVSLDLDPLFGIDDDAYLALTDAEDDALQALLDNVAAHEKNPLDNYSEADYSEGNVAADGEEWATPEELAHLFETIEETVTGEPAKSAELVSAENLQINREGFTPTDTPEFKAWFHDDSGKLTLPDGQPRVLLSGGKRMGRTSINFDLETKSSPGFWATDEPRIAEDYAKGSTSHTYHSLMDAVYGDNQTAREVKLRNAESWQDAIDYVAEYWQNNGTGLRVVGLTADGSITEDLSAADRYALQTDLASQMDFIKYGAFGEGEFRDVAVFPATEEGLRSFNHYIGEAVDQLNAGVSGWIKVYGTAQHTLVVDADGWSYSNIPTEGLPAELLEGGIPRRGTSHTDDPNYVHVNDLVRHAFKNGYDAVILENIDDLGGIQTQYAFRDSSQIKSVYNGGDWSAEDSNFKFSQENRQTVDDFIRRFNEEHGEGAAEQLYQTVQELQRAKARAERKLDAQRESQQAERSLNEQARRDNATAWLIYHKKTLRTVQREYRAKLDEAHRAKAEAVKNAVAETRAVERATADLRVEQQKTRDTQKLESTVLAERMNAKKQAAKRLRVKEDAYTGEKLERRDNDKLRRNAAKSLLRDNRRVAERRAVIETEQGPIDTIRKNPKERTALERVQGAADSLRTLGRSAYRAFVNQATDIDRFAKRQQSGTLASTLVNIVGGASTTTETIYKRGLVDRAGNRIGESMSDVFLCWDEKGKHVDESKQALLQDYMLHKHNIDRMSFVEKARTALESYEAKNPWLAEMDAKELAKLTAMTDAEVKKLGKQEAREAAKQYAKLLNDYSEARDKPVFPDQKGNPITAATSREVVAKYEADNPWLAEKAEDIYRWWDRFMRTWVVGDSLSEADYETMREMYPHYVPTYRADKKALGAGNFVGMGGASVGSVVKKAKGGLSEIVNIEDSFANLANKAIRVARTNELYKNMVDTAMLDGEGLFSDMAVFDWDSTRLGRAYYAADGTEVRLDSSEARKAEAADALERAEQAGLVKTKDGYRLSAWYDGELLSAFVSEDLFKSIQNTTGSSANDLEKGLLKIGNALTGPMKTAITGINPNFAMRNISRDLPTAIVNSISGMAFPKYWAQAAKEIGTKSERWQQYQALGGTNSTYYNDQQGFAKVMSQGDSLGSKIIGKVGAFNEITEAQTRFAEYLATIDRLGDTYENRLLGIKNSAEVTVDFSRKGRYGKVINAWVPYWNPAVQGIDKVFRSVVESPDGSAVWKQATKTLGRAAMTTVLFEALLYAWLKGHDDYDEWEELSDRVKDTYYCIPTSDHKFLKIPKNREWGAILGTPLMRLLESANGRDDPFENYIETSLAPNFLPGAVLGFNGERLESDVIGVSQALDLAYNEDFAGRTIVPYAYQQGSLTEQYDAETSVFSRKLGELLNFSPMQIDYLLEDYFGDFGDLFTMATAEATWSGEASVAEDVKKLFTSPWFADNRYSNQTVSDYYETLTDLEKRVQDKRNQLGDEAQDTVDYKTQKAMEKLYGKEIKELNRSARDMPDGEEKDQIKARVALLAGNALDFYEQAMNGSITEPALTAEYAALPTVLSDELIRLDGLSGDYSFTPGNYTPSKYNDPRKKGYEYVLDDEQKDKYKELYRETYAKIMSEVIRKDKYQKGSDTKKAEMLETARDDVTEETKDAFLDWLRVNYRSTKKSK